MKTNTGWFHLDQVSIVIKLIEAESRAVATSDLVRQGEQQAVVSQSVSFLQQKSDEDLLHISVKTLNMTELYIFKCWNF